ncbi:MAG: SpoIIE family protein phosphatase [Ruminococcus sp.]|nr:SpoIIE family protein phosphatase [Ruminococcus sp.]
MQKVVSVTKNKDDLKLRTALMCVTAFASGFFFSGAKLLGSGFSLGVCAAAVSGVYSPFAVLGMFAYYILFGTLMSSVAKLCSALLSAVLVVFLKKHNYFAPCVLGVGCCMVMLLVNAVEAVGRGYEGYMLTFNMIDALICACVIFMFLSLADEYHITGKLNISGIRGFFAAVLYIMLVCALTSVPLPLDLGRVFATVVLLYFAKKYRAIGGALIGVLTSVATALCMPSLASNTLIMSSSGLICGALFTLSDFAALCSFIITTLVSLAAVGVNSDTFVMFWDIVIGVVISVLLPVKLFKAGRSVLSSAKSTVDLVGQTASSRLGYAAKTLSDVRRDISLISLKIGDRYRPLSLSKRVESAVCSKCECCELCRKNRAEHSKAMAILENISNSYGVVTFEDIDSFMPTCSKKPAIEAAFMKAADELAYETANDIAVSRMRELLCEQLLSMEDLLNDMSCRVGRIKEVDELLCQRAKEMFDICGCKGARVCVYTNENHRLFVEAFVNKSFKSDIIRLTVKLSDVVGCDMELPSVNAIGKVTRLVFTEKPELGADIATYQASCKGGEYCGDTVDTITLNESERYIILSDGMGTGERARLDSMFTVNLVRRLISSGISMSCAERLINSALSVKSWDESFSTLDVLRLDLFSHTASFLKAGAAASYIIREGSIIKISSHALPTGILTKCDPDVRQIKICAGDIIIIASDGLDEQLILESEGLAEKLGCLSPDAAVRYIGELAVGVNDGNVVDDITVAAVRIENCAV